MSAEVLGSQFIKRRAAQLALEGRSLVRPAPPAKGTQAASRAVHPAGKKRPPQSVAAYKEQKFDAILDQVQTPQEQLDAEPKVTPKPPVRRRNLRSV